MIQIPGILCDFVFSTGRELYWIEYNVPCEMGRNVKMSTDKKNKEQRTERRESMAELREK